MTKSEIAEVRKHITITKELDERLKVVQKLLNSTETNIIKNALYCYLKEVK